MGWWILDRFAYDMEFGGFDREGKAWVCRGEAHGTDWHLIKPRTFMNRSGEALTSLWRMEGFDVASDLMVLTDDANLDVARVRIRPGGGAGGHNGLRSVTGALGTDHYARLRVGVGLCPPGTDLADWVLSPMPEDDEAEVVSLLPELSRAILVWASEGPEVAMNQFNR